MQERQEAPGRRPQKRAQAASLRARASRKLALVVAATLVVCGGGTTAAWSYWSQNVALSATVSAGTVAAPASLTCESKMRVPILGPAYVLLSWPAGADAAGYAISVRTADGTAVAQIATTNSATRSLEITAALLNGLVGSLLTFLLGGETVYAYVETIHASGWRSEPTPIKGIKSSGLLSGLLGGVACA